MLATKNSINIYKNKFLYTNDKPEYRYYAVPENACKRLATPDE